VLVDLLGYYSDGVVPPPPGGALTMLATGQRVVDTRIGLGSIQAPMPRKSTRTFDLTGVGGIPSTGVGSVVLNLTALNTTAPSSHVTVWPADETKPVTSSLNWVEGQVVNNYVIAKVDSGGLVKLFNNEGEADIIIDVVGWYSS
jgi:hypothetical protein